MDLKELTSALTEATKITDARSHVPAMRDALLWLDGHRARIVAAALCADIDLIEVGAWFDLGPCTDSPCCVAFSPREALRAVKTLATDTIQPSDLLAARSESCFQSLRRRWPSRLFSASMVTTRDAQALVFMLGAVVAAQQITVREYDAAPLRHLMAQSAFAMSKDVTRPSMHAAHLTARADGLTMRATDGHRLVRCDVACAPLDLPAMRDSADRAVLIPAAGLLAIQRLIGRKAPTVAIGVEAERFRTIQVNNLRKPSAPRLAHEVREPQYLRASAGPVSIVVRVNAVTGSTIPAYDQVVPRTDRFVVKVQRKDLATALKQVLAVANPRSHACALSVSESNHLVVHADDEGKSHTARVAISSPRDLNFAIGVSARYLLDAIEPLTGPEVSIAMTGDAQDPIKVTADHGVLCVLMPCRI